MKLLFEKYQALGNDFVILDFRSSKSKKISRVQIIRICDRTKGIGCDQLMYVLRSRHKGVDAVIEIYNQDGSRAKMCGNGVRAVALYLYLKQLKKNLNILTDSGVIPCRILTKKTVSAEIPIRSVRKIAAYKYRVNVGNLHEVTVVLNLRKIKIPPQLKSINREYVKKTGNKMIARVFESGVGETKACGTGAIAIACSQEKAGKYQIEFVGGVATVTLDKTLKKGTLLSEVECVFSGSIEL